MRPPSDADTWVALSDDPLPVGDATKWVVLPRCGGVAVFVGTARDHAADRAGITEVVYEAYEEQAVPRLAAVADEVRTRWPDVGRVALLHRTGSVAVCEAAAVVAVSAPLRAEAFDAARFAVDAVRATVPIWKKERWDGGEAWCTDTQHLVDLVGMGGAR
jgi:molybdopterin synthase catalytic subunit